MKEVFGIGHEGPALAAGYIFRGVKREKRNIRLAARTIILITALKTVSCVLNYIDFRATHFGQHRSHIAYIDHLTIKMDGDYRF